MSERKQHVRFLMVTRESDFPNNNAKPLRMLLPVKAIKQIQVTERTNFNVEAYTVSDYYYYVVTAHPTAGMADCALGQLMDYLNGI